MHSSPSIPLRRRIAAAAVATTIVGSACGDSIDYDVQGNFRCLSGSVTATSPSGSTVTPLDAPTTSPPAATGCDVSITTIAQGDDTHPALDVRMSSVGFTCVVADGVSVRGGFTLPNQDTWKAGDLFVVAAEESDLIWTVPPEVASCATFQSSAGVHVEITDAKGSISAHPSDVTPDFLVHATVTFGAAIPSCVDGDGLTHPVGVSFQGTGVLEEAASDWKETVMESGG